MLKLLKKRKAEQAEGKSTQVTQEAAQIIEKYKGRERGIVELLQEISAEFSYLPEQIIKQISRELKVPLTQIYSVATFYKSFKLIPPGEHYIYVCTGTTCHVRGAPQIIDTLRRELKIKPGGTTEDGKFSLETVNCLGVCALAPTVVIDEKYYAKMNSNKMIKLLKKY